jgi:hypothetical protein
MKGSGRFKSLIEEEEQVQGRSSTIHGSWTYANKDQLRSLLYGGIKHKLLSGDGGFLSVSQIASHVFRINLFVSLLEQASSLLR